MSEKLEASVEEIYDIGGFTRTESQLDIPHPDPLYHYRWVNSKIPARLERFLRGGYGIVQPEHAKRIFGAKYGIFDPNGRIAVGDLVLLCISIDRYERIRKVIRERDAQQQSGVLDQFMASTSEIAKGVKGFVQDREEFNEEKRIVARGTHSRTGYGSR